MREKGMSAAWRYCLLACLLCLSQLAQAAGVPAVRMQPARDPPQVLVLMSYHYGYSWEDRILEGFEEWGGITAGRPVLHVEWMDTKRHRGLEQRARFAAYLTEKYAGQHFDLVMTADDNALEFALQQEMLAGIPIVFGGINGDPRQIIGTRSGVTGVAERFDLVRTLRLALALHPEVKRLVFMTTADESGVGTRQHLSDALARLGTGVQVEHWVTRRLAEVEGRLAGLGPDALLFALGSLPLEDGGRPFSPEELVAYVHARSNCPVYSDLDATVGRGALGGYMNSGLENGRLMARMAQHVLAGQRPEEIPIVYETPLALLFDYRELRRFGIAERDLPRGSQVLNRPPSIFDPEYRHALLGFSGVIALLLLVLAGVVLRGRLLASRQAALHHQATHDDLTRLPNRAWLNEQLQQGKWGGGRALALVMMDLNRFQLINDTYGHSFGDEVLTSVADRLAGLLDGRTELVRFSGDSFVVLRRLEDPLELGDFCEQCERILAEPFQVSGHRLSVSAAFGATLAGPDEIDRDRLLREADTAMHEAKRERGNHVVVFDRDIHERALRQFRLEAWLPNAVARGEIQVYFQPIVEAGSGGIAGFEALARWQHPELGWVPPPEFIRAAIESGCIRELTLGMLRAACRAFQPYLEAVSRPYLGVNVSVSDIYAEDFPGRVAAILAEERMPPERLVLEVTEDMLLGDVGNATLVLGRLRELGLRIAIDDFGTGYSSMSYLSSFMVNIIKIDQSFVRNLTTSASDQKIVRAIVSMAADLELSVVTEGVETPGQLELLRQLGCRLLQGYIYGRPQPAGSWLREDGLNRETGIRPCADSRP